MREALAKGERAEEYPDDTPFPSYWVLGLAGSRVLHVVAADDHARSETIVITTYEPDPNEREADYKNEEEGVTCVICKRGEVKPGRTTLTVERGAMTLVVRDIPARVRSPARARSASRVRSRRGSGSEAVLAGRALRSLARQ